CNVFTTDQNLAPLVDANFPARENFANRALGGMEGMIQADQRSGFRHAVSLDRGISETRPECFNLFRQRGPSGDEGPELPAEARTDVPETPPAPKKVLFLCTSEIFVELPRQAVTVHFFLDF